MENGKESLSREWVEGTIAAIVGRSAKGLGEGETLLGEQAQDDEGGSLALHSRNIKRVC